MYVYIYIYTYVCVYIYIYTYIHTYTHLPIFVASRASDLLGHGHECHSPSNNILHSTKRRSREPPPSQSGPPVKVLYPGVHSSYHGPTWANMGHHGPSWGYL